MAPAGSYYSQSRSAVVHFGQSSSAGQLFLFPSVFIRGQLFLFPCFKVAPHYRRKSSLYSILPNRIVPLAPRVSLTLRGWEVPYHHLKSINLSVLCFLYNPDIFLLISLLLPFLQKYRIS